jgi:hypothetical protein
MTHSSAAPARRRWRTALGALAAGALLAALGAAPASAASSIQCIVKGDPGNPAVANVDDSVGIDVAFTDDFPDVVAGQPFAVTPSVNYNLSNEYLVSLGKRGLLATGDNRFNGLTFWVAVTASNTVEQRQVLRATVGTSGRGAVYATIDWDPAANSGAGAVTVQRTDRDGVPTGSPTANLAGTATLNSTGIEWTPTSTAPVSFAVAPAGTLGAVKVQEQWLRNNDAVSPPAGDVDHLVQALAYGSVYARVRIGDEGAARGRTSLDCLPGAAYLLEPTIPYAEGGNVEPSEGGDRGRYTVQAGSPPAIASVTPEATLKRFQCIDHLGRYRGREINGYDIGFSVPSVGTYEAGKPYALRGATGRITIHSPMVKGLYANLYSYRSLPADGKLDQPFRLWVAVQGEHTTQGVQFLPVEGRWQASFVDPDGVVGSGDEVFPAATVTFNLPDSTWTPTGGGDVRFAIAAPGQIPTLTLVGFGHSGDAGAVFPMSPYGSVFIRAETGRYGSSIDCLEGSIRIADPAIGFSNLGRNSPDVLIPTPVPAGSPPTGRTVPSGSAGRYAITHTPGAPFAIVPAKVADAKPQPAPKSKPAIASRGLTVGRGGAVKIALSCPRGGPVCKGAVRVRTAFRVRLRRGARKRFVVVGLGKRYTLAAGATKSVSLKVTRAAKRLLDRNGRLSVRIVVDPSDGPAKSKRVTLRD